MIKLKSPNILTLEATSGASADGSSTSTITATLLNGNTPVSGEEIDLSATSLTAAFSPSGLSHTTVTTDSSGMATAALTDTVEESVTVKGTLLSDTSVTAQTTVTFGNIWNSFYRLDTLKVDFRDNSSASSATIFGNGNNQVTVLVHVKILGPDASTVLSIPEDELKQQISLINYGTGEKLNYNGNSPDSNKPWVYSDEDKGFADAYQYNSTLPVTEHTADTDVSIITFYISADDLASGLDTGVSINVPGVGEFNTTSNGTSTKNGPKGESGSVFKSPSFVHLSALSRIDYTDATNLYVSGMPSSYDDFNEIATDMLINLYVSTPPDDPDAYPEDSTNFGRSAQTKMTISPAISALKFKKTDITRNNTKMSGMNIVGLNHSSDMIWGVPTTDWSYFDATFIFINQNNYGVNYGQINTSNDIPFYYSYVINDGDSRHQFTQELSEGIITINLCNHRISPNELEELSGYKWESEGSPVTINVADYYGNDGVVTITTVDNQWPKLVINQ